MDYILLGAFALPFIAGFFDIQWENAKEAPAVKRMNERQYQTMDSLKKKD